VIHSEGPASLNRWPDSRRIELPDSGLQPLCDLMEETISRAKSSVGASSSAFKRCQERLCNQSEAVLAQGPAAFWPRLLTDGKQLSPSPPKHNRLRTGRRSLWTLQGAHGRTASSILCRLLNSSSPMCFAAVSTDALSNSRLGISLGV